MGRTVVNVRLTDAEWQRIEHAIYSEVNGFIGAGLDSSETPRRVIESILTDRLAQPRLTWDFVDRFQHDVYAIGTRYVGELRMLLVEAVEPPTPEDTI